MKQLALFAAPVLALVAFAAPAWADPAEIVAIEATRSGDSWRFAVTLRHGDTGWDDYADGWRVETADGTVLGTRVLAHPHVQEQPFTRALGGVTLPEGLGQVFLRSSDSVGGWAETTTPYDLPR